MIDTTFHLMPINVTDVPPPGEAALVINHDVPQQSYPETAVSQTPLQGPSIGNNNILTLLGRAPSEQNEIMKRETFAINLRNSKRRDIINHIRLANS